ncbi:MAG: hypothetical protein CBC35_08780 [Planctomycetes bacterium TMED75]|nr:hypothetical protein [Planctomycetaceae bacterium]OUU91770.1 MAG: hypothetical protein CBC35_08780 [Planctomycetes bacterium TMED75]
MTHRRMLWMSAVCLGSAGFLMLGGCDNNSQNREALLAEEASTLRLELDKQKTQNRTLTSENQKLNLRNQQLESDLASNSKPAPLAATPRTIGGFDVEMRNGEIVVNLPSDVLFDSGRDSLKSPAKSSLNRVASELKADYPGKSIRLIGFTDTDPIKKSKERYETNHHLGFERAFSVGEYLQTKGIPSSKISYASYGPHAPKGNKSQSRRVELVVLVDQ